ncbi:hypothetical protein Taro_053752 [Colocasia esculenta]|uniref:Aminotransferase-like plant mobile domain-containing protein n=1 Tax=Colocasia esculenta TaxID=4460 RepID=A0A843XLZ5_COLES|nr:hypothetical protein [Colocasia esculenta]
MVSRRGGASRPCRGDPGRRDLIAALEGDAIRSRCPALSPQGRGCHGCRDSNRTQKADWFTKWKLLQGEMRARVSWVVVLAVFLAFPPFQRERVEEMGFGGIFRIERMRVDSALTQALQSRWDAEAITFVFPWGHMIPSLKDVSRITRLRIYGKPVSGYTYPCYHDLAERLLELPVERRSSLVPRVPLQESLGLFDVGKVAGESEDEHLDRLTWVSWRELVSEPGVQADLDLRRFLVLFHGRLLFATRSDAVHCRFLPLLEDLAEVGGYAWGAAFLAHQFDSLGASERQTSISGFFPFLQVWPYLHLPALGRGDLTRPGLVPIARRWDSRRDSRNLWDQLERLQEAIDSYPHLDVAWQPYLGEGDEGQPWLVQARPYFCSAHLAFGRVLWRSPSETGFADRVGVSGDFTTLPIGTSGRRSRLTTESAEERVSSQMLPPMMRTPSIRFENWANDLKCAAHRRSWGDCIAPSLALLGGARSGGSAEADSRAGGSPSLLEAQLAGAVLRAEEAQRHLEEWERDLQLTTEHAMDLQGERDRLRGEVQTTRSERDQLRIRAEAAEAQVAQATKEMAALRVQRSPGDQEEVTRLHAELLA